MDRAALLSLDTEALIGLVLQFQQRVAALEAELAKLRQPPKTPENSSVPPSQARKPNLSDGRKRKPGARRGHLGSSRRRAAPDLVIRCYPAQCQACGAGLPRTGQRRIGRSQVVELPPVEPKVLEAWRYAAECQQCGARTVAAAPEGFAPEQVFGPRVSAVAGYLHEAHHLSYQRLVAVLLSLFGLRISAGAIAGVLQRLAARAKPAAEAIKEQVRASPVINSDETGARVNGSTWWHWVFQTPEASYHLLAPSRGAAVIDDFLDGAVPEVWGSDCAPGQLGTPADDHQICMSHQLRDLTYADQADGALGAQWARQLRHVFGRAVRLHHERAAVTPETFTRRRTLIERAAERLIFGPPLGRGEAGKLQRRYQREWESLFVFLHRDDVEPTNNSSERDLRNSVIHRKVTGGYRSDWGAEAGGIFTTILQTARKRGEDGFATLLGLSGTSPLTYADTAS
ncbi:MAG: IS66 family transposase [Gemmatimonadales bacterium]